MKFMESQSRLRLYNFHNFPSASKDAGRQSYRKFHDLTSRKPEETMRTSGSDICCNTISCSAPTEVIQDLDAVGSNLGGYNPSRRFVIGHLTTIHSCKPQNQKMS